MSRKRSTLSLSRGERPDSGGKVKELEMLTVPQVLIVPTSQELLPPHTPASITSTSFQNFSSNSMLVFPVHGAAQKGNFVEFSRLLGESSPFRQDFKARTPLHYAANYGNQGTALLMTVELFNCTFIMNAEEVAQMRAQLINVQDENGETALHLAAKNGHRKIVQLFLFAGADVNIESKEGLEPIELIYSNVPQAMCAVFNTAIEYRSGEIGEQSFDVLIDFGPIVGFPGEEEVEDPFFIESQLLAYALKNSKSKCKEVLIHPLVQLFLHFKWNKVRPLFWTSIIVHVLWLLAFSTFLLDLYLHRCPFIPNYNVTNTTAAGDSSEVEASLTTTVIECKEEDIDVKWAVVAASISIIMAFKELFELCSVPTFGFYFSKLENWGQLLLMVLVGLTTLPVWNYLLYKGPHTNIHAWQYQAAAFGVFLAWTLILGQIGQTPRLGIYVEILLRVLKSFGLFVLTFTSLLTAFALSFSILMPQHDAFRTWPLALSKVLVMMTGELNYDDIFYSEEGEPIPFQTSEHLLFALFTVTVTIILFNLLIGLTVSDIQGLQAGANVSLLSGQLEQIYLMETFIFSKHMRRMFSLFRLNANWLKRFQIAALDEDELYGVIIPTNCIPKELQSEVKELAMQNLGQNDDPSSQLQDEDEAGLQNMTKEDLKNLIQESVLQGLQQHFKNTQEDRGIVEEQSSNNCNSL